jgi:hypothetical protein
MHSAVADHITLGMHSSSLLSFDHCLISLQLLYAKRGVYMDAPNRSVKPKISRNAIRNSVWLERRLNSLTIAD